MNVFVLDRSMEKSAQYLDDAHLLSQINEACQIITANANAEKYPGAKIGHLNHMVTRYYTGPLTAELVSYLKFCLLEYRHRFGKDHQNWFWFWGYISCVHHEEPSLTRFVFARTAVNKVMTDNIDTIRRYISTKPHTRPLKWTRREKPEWWEG